MTTHGETTLDQLIARLTDLEHANARLREEIVALHAARPTDAAEAVPGTSRRAVLHAAAKVAVAGAAALAGAGLVGPRPARAVTTDDQFIATGPTPVGFLTNSPTIDRGVDAAGNEIGVRGVGAGPLGVGGWFEGPNRAPLHLEPVMVNQPPAAGQCGDLYVTTNVDNFCQLWFHTGIAGWRMVSLI